jgi:hypothetical protein
VRVAPEEEVYHERRARGSGNITSHYNADQALRAIRSTSHVLRRYKNVLCNFYSTRAMLSIIHSILRGACLAALVLLAFGKNKGLNLSLYDAPPLLLPCNKYPYSGVGEARRFNMTGSAEWTESLAPPTIAFALVGSFSQLRESALFHKPLSTGVALALRQQQ